MTDARQRTWFQDWFEALTDSVGETIKGKRREVGFVLLSLMAGGHVLVEDNPGTGKTSLARALAASTSSAWKRIQFTPDLLPSDVTGAEIPNPQTREFEFQPGPIFAQFVLADEINRASPKTQSALLEVMEEGRVTVGGTAYAVPQPFIVLATQNPVEQAGVYQLPEAQLDRFMIRLKMDYPDHDAEIQMLQSMADGHKPEDTRAIITPENIQELRAFVNDVRIDEKVHSYVVRLCSHTRDQMSQLELGVSPRGSVALMKMARAMAAAQGRDYVSPNDVKSVAPYVLAHRIKPTADARLGFDGPLSKLQDSIIADAIRAVQVPDLVGS